MITKVHTISAFLGFMTIAVFFTSTILIELSGDHDSIYFVKQCILYGLIVLIPSIMAAGISGNLITKNKNGKLIKIKISRLKIVVFNGVVILLPSAFFLASLAGSGNYSEWFYIIQALELFAGAANLYFLGLNIRDGFLLSARFKKTNTHGSI